jgi:hypothetical protein
VHLLLKLPVFRSTFLIASGLVTKSLQPDPPFLYKKKKREIWILGYPNRDKLPYQEETIAVLRIDQMKAKLLCPFQSRVSFQNRDKVAKIVLIRNMSKMFWWFQHIGDFVADQNDGCTDCNHFASFIKTRHDLIIIKFGYFWRSLQKGAL